MIYAITSAIGLVALIVTYFWGKSSSQADNLKDKSEALNAEAQEWADSPVTVIDTIKRLRDRAAKKN